MTIKELYEQKEQAIMSAERDYDNAIEELMEGMTPVERVLAVTESFGADGYIRQIFKSPSLWDHPEVVYSDKDVTIKCDFMNGYFDVLRLSDDQYTELKERSTLKCEW